MILENKKRVSTDTIGSIYTAKSLAEELGVSSRLIHYFRNTGKLNSITSGKARYYFRKEDVMNFLRDRGYDEI